MKGWKAMNHDYTLLSRPLWNACQQLYVSKSFFSLGATAPSTSFSDFFVTDA